MVPLSVRRLTDKQMAKNMNIFSEKMKKYKVHLALMLSLYVILGIGAFFIKDEVLTRIFLTVFMVLSVYFILSRRKHDSRRKPLTITIFISVMISSLLYYENGDILCFLMNLGAIAFSVLTLLLFFKMYDRLGYSLG